MRAVYCQFKISAVAYEGIGAFQKSWATHTFP